MLHCLGAKGLDIRAELDAIDKSDRPELRRCTVRGHDAERGMLTFDVVTHGESGPGSAWALHAQAGDEVGIRATTSTWRRKAGIQLLVADSTSAPAMRGLLEACTDAELAATHVRIAAPSPDLLEPGHDSFRSELASYKEHFVPEGAEAAAAAAALRRGGRPRFALRDNAVQDEVPWDRFAFFREKMLLNDRRNGKCGRWVR